MLKELPWLQASLWFLPPTPTDATMLGSWPSASELSVLAAKIPSTPPSLTASNPGEVLRWAFAKDQLALLQQLDPLVIEARAGKTISWPPLRYPESEKHLSAALHDTSPDLVAIKAIVLASAGQTAEALQLVDGLPFGTDPDWNAGLAVFALGLHATKTPSLAAKYLDPLLYSPHWAAVVEALYLESFASAGAGVSAKDIAAHGVAWVERLSNNGALAAGVPLALLENI